ncbi:Gfo/Idh/MocA family protein [Enterococcus massiliensis]|uniref:Gfo/Idh/MocA family protein n=1 Tax=Enterococcus massiliensis TaxID=1640685 RepID=UPI00065E03B1|nr:Gfo/Idh/MocA family oxidoreductase [Enterococcus massiliensis]
MNSKKIKIGIISFEHMHALSYTTALSEMDNIEIVGIFDEDEFRGTEMASRFETKYFRKGSELFSETLDGIVICSNNKDHVKYVEKSIEKKIPFIVEKPLANSFENGKKIVDIVKNSNVLGMIAFPMRFNPGILEAKRCIDNGEIGEILSITGINHGKIPTGWFLEKNLSGGGAIIDHTVHIADLIRWFTRSEFSQVFASGGELLHHRGIDDTGIILGNLENKVKISIDCSWAHHTNYPIWPQVDLDIIGTKGSMQIKGFSQVLEVVNKNSGVNEEIVWGDDGDGQMMEAFVHLCHSHEMKSDYPTVQDGFEALKVALAAYRSIDEKNSIQI